MAAGSESQAAQRRVTVKAIRLRQGAIHMGYYSATTVRPPGGYVSGLGLIALQQRRPEVGTRVSRSAPAVNHRAAALRAEVLPWSREGGGDPSLLLVIMQA